jgi:tetratricopeptide (TPR) repeat protein
MKRQWVRFTTAASATIALSVLLVSCAGNPQKAKLKYLQKGEDYMKKGQYSSAAIEFRNALKVDPRYTDAYLQLAKADLALRDGNGAFQALNQGVDADPSRLDLRIARAGLFNLAHHYPEAAEDAKYVLQKDPKNVEAHILLGTVLGIQGKYNDALQEFSKAVALAPNNPVGYVGVAQANLALNNRADAELNFKKAIEVDPHSVQTYAMLANFYQAQKEGAQVQQTLQAGIKANPSTISLYIDLAAFYEQQGKQSDAEGVLTNLSHQLPQSAEAAGEIGNFYLAARMNDRALAEFQRALSLDPKNINNKEYVESVYLDQGQFDQAKKLDDELLKQAPDDVLVRTNHGRVLMSQGKFSDAIQTLQKATSDAPEDSGAHYFLALAYLENKDAAQANSELQQTVAKAENQKKQSLRTPPFLPLALIQLAELNLSQQKFTVAQLYAQELVDTAGGNPGSHLLLGTVFLNLKQIKPAADEFAKAQTLAPDNPDVHTHLGLLYIQENNIPQAEKEFKTAMDEAPHSVSVLADYVGFLVAQKQLPKANVLLTQFLAQNPNESGAHYLLGSLDMMENKDPDALSETQKAVQINPKNAEAYVQMGQIYRDQGNDPAAIEAYQQAIANGAPSAPVVTEIGNLYMNKGDLSKASEQFQKALNIDPNFAPAANNLAWVYAEQGQNLDVALGLAQKAKAEDPRTSIPETASISDTLAWVMFRRGNYAAALPLLQDCVKKQPDKAQYHFHLGMVLVADGQKTEGKVQLQEALNIKSSNGQNNLDSLDADQARKALSQ